MSLDLYVGPRRKRRWRVFWLAGAILLITGLVAWQYGWRPEPALTSLGQQVPLPISTMPASSSEAAESGPVVLVTAAVVENPHSQAYTADLYSAKEEGIPWPNAGGRTQVEIYTVQDGDTLWGIATKFELDVNTLRWSNPELERNPDVLAVGTELRILPVKGVYHLVTADDTLETIAVRYGVAETDITDYPPNALYPPYELTPGDGLIIPYGRKDLAVPKPALSADFPLAWPVVGFVTGGFQPDHQAIDIGAPYGATVYAADSGTIIYADWAEEGYGYTVIIDHGDGWQTWYNHLKGTLLGAGSFVYRGTPIAEVGSTGHSEGPHLHFEVRLNDEWLNPLDYLPGNPQ